MTLSKVGLDVWAPTCLLQPHHKKFFSGIERSPPFPGKRNLSWKPFNAAVKNAESDVISVWMECFCESISAPAATVAAVQAAAAAAGALQKDFT